MLKQLKLKMEKYIQKYGLNSDKTINISQQLDCELNKYYEYSSMKYFYEQSKSGLLKYYNVNNKYPNIFEWNSYAKSENYLSFISIEYMSSMNFDRWCKNIITIN